MMNYTPAVRVKCLFHPSIILFTSRSQLSLHKGRKRLDLVTYTSVLKAYKGKIF